MSSVQGEKSSNQTREWSKRRREREEVESSTKTAMIDFSMGLKKQWISELHWDLPLKRGRERQMPVK